MTCDLDRLYRTLVDSLPTIDDGGESTFAASVANLPRPPSELLTSALCIRWHYHFYNHSPIEAIQLYSRRTTYRQLGLLLLSRVFHPTPERVELRLCHPDSQVTRLLLECQDYRERDWPRYIELPHRFNYSVEKVQRYPGWCPRDVNELPVVCLTNQEEVIRSPEDMLTRDTAIGFGEVKGWIYLAELLLNFGAPQNDIDEVALEGECGNRGVGPGSAEIRMWLPGSLGFIVSEQGMVD